MIAQLILALALLQPSQQMASAPASPAAVSIDAARKHLEAGRTEEGIASFKEALKSEPNNAVAHNALGSLFNSSGRYAEALPHAEAAVAADPGNARFRYNRGVVLAEHGRFREAIADFDAALSAHPDMTYAWLERGAAKLSLGNMAGAREDWRKAGETDPKLIWAVWYSATGDFIDGRFDKAAKGFDQVAAAEPGFVPAQLWRTIAHARAGTAIANPAPAGSDWPAAVLEHRLGRISPAQLLEAAVEDRASGDRRREAEALYFLGQFELIAGRPAAAKTYFERALAIPSPRHVWRMSAEQDLRKLGGR